MVSIMHKLGLHSHLRGRDDHRDGITNFSEESGDLLTHSFWADASLRFDGTGASDLMDHTGLIDDWLL
jgi:hypothetical protein